ncbi:MAG: MBOAT family O-acyltransferase [Eubacteriales bacterium]|nr:MBOAT family O-acyltransferase [Eubacteriales bacterium]
MQFNSYIFLLLFLPLSVTGYFLLHRLRRPTLAKAYLLGMSLWFYGFFNWTYFLIMGASIGVNFGMNRIMSRTKAPAVRRAAFWTGMLLNIGILFYFKYTDFFISNINAVLGSEIPLLHLVLPLGISFYTFQQLGYMIDSYKGKAPDYNFLDYALFVSFFPQLVAGPIVLHSEIAPQFADEKKHRLNWDNVLRGLYALGFGLAKKVLLADTLGLAVNWAYANIPALNSTSALLAMLCYMLQIYLDFSGYCDIATGAALLFNIELPVNFRSPYRACTIAGFWERWHITLTRFFTTYVYIPLGGSRKGVARACLNTMIVFTISGFWHGAGWTYILFGMAYGLMLVGCRIWKKQIARTREWILYPITFVLNLFNISLFRASSLGDALLLWKQVFRFDFGPVAREMSQSVLITEFDLLMNKVLPNLLPQWLPLVALAAFCMYASTGMKNVHERLAVFRPTPGRALVAVALIGWSVLSLSGVTTFLYFNF